MDGLAREAELLSSPGDAADFPGAGDDEEAAYLAGLSHRGPGLVDIPDGGLEFFTPR